MRIKSYKVGQKETGDKREKRGMRPKRGEQAM